MSHYAKLCRSVIALLLAGACGFVLAQSVKTDEVGETKLLTRFGTLKIRDGEPLGNNLFINEKKVYEAELLSFEKKWQIDDKDVVIMNEGESGNTCPASALFVIVSANQLALARIGNCEEVSLEGTLADGVLSVPEANVYYEGGKVFKKRKKGGKPSEIKQKIVTLAILSPAELVERAVQQIRAEKQFDKKVADATKLADLIREMDLKNVKNRSHYYALENYISVMSDLRSKSDCENVRSEIKFVDRNPTVEKQELSEPARLALRVLSSICE